MRDIWRSVWGEKLWHLLRGMELPEEITERRSVRPQPCPGAGTARPGEGQGCRACLTLKAAGRLRRMEYYAGAMSSSARLESDASVHAEARLYRAQDNKTFLDLLEGLWTQALRQSAGASIKKVSVTLSELVAATNLQSDLYTNLQDADLAARGKLEKTAARHTRD
jgi:DNA polymerase-4